MKHLMILCLLLAAQVIRADDNPPTPLPEPNDTWESFQISNGALTWESKSEVAPWRTLYSNIWFVDYYKKPYRISGVRGHTYDEDQDAALMSLRFSYVCRSSENSPSYCKEDSPDYWKYANFNNDERFCKAFGKSSSVDYKTIGRDRSAVVFDRNLRAIGSLQEIHVFKTVISSVICAD